MARRQGLFRRELTSDHHRMNSREDVITLNRKYISNMTFKTRKLYGGAIAVEVPDQFYDVSDLRQVPDTQEVYQECDGYHTLIADLLDYVGKIEEPEEAARYHLEDIVSGDGKLTIWHLEKIRVPHLGVDIPAISLLATTAADQDSKVTAIFLTLVRLKEHATDMVITMNLKDVTTGGAKDFDALFCDPADVDFHGGKEIMRRFVESIEIRDYSLFHPDDDEDMVMVEK